MRNFSKGFTIVELLIYMGLLALFFSVLIEIFVSMVDVRLESEARSSVEQDGRFILSRALYDMARANDVITPATLGETTNTLTLRIGGVEHTYALAGGSLTLTDDQGTDTLNGSQTQVTAATFTRIGNLGGKDTVRMDITLESIAHRVGEPGVVKTFQTTGGRR